jgi:dolichyl-phosphate-mannose-protein mannosyltransferase
MATRDDPAGLAGPALAASIHPPRVFARLATFLWCAALAGAAGFILIYLAVAVLRLRYPYHLEWMEGGAFCQVRWILSGHPLYVHPRLRFAPFTYTPLYFYLSAAFAAVLGEGLFPLRLVSFLSSLGCFWFLFLLGSRASSRAAGLLSAGLFAATFAISGGWFDLARVDSLFLLFILAGVHLVRFGRSHRAAVGAAALLTLGYLTKQSALIVAAPLALWSLLARPRWFLTFAGTLAALVLGGTLLLDRLHHGWFWFYNFELPLAFPAIRLPLLQFLGRDILAPLAIAVPLAALYLLLLVRRPWRTEQLFYPLFYPLLGLGMLAIAYLSRRKAGGFLNDLIPAYAFVALLFGLAVDELRRRSTGNITHMVNIALSTLCIAQFVLLSYDPRAQLPSPADRRAGDEIVSRLRAIQGDVLLPEFSYLAGLAGKPIYANSMATLDILRGKDRTLAREMLQELQGAVQNDRFAALLFAMPDWLDKPLLGGNLADYRGSRIVYKKAPGEPAGGRFSRGTRWTVRTGSEPLRPEAESDAFLPLTGYPLRPILLYTLERPSPPPSGRSLPRGGQE